MALGHQTCGPNKKGVRKCALELRHPAVFFALPVRAKSKQMRMSCPSYVCVADLLSVCFSRPRLRPQTLPSSVATMQTCIVCQQHHLTSLELLLFLIYTLQRAVAPHVLLQPGSALSLSFSWSSVRLGLLGALASFVLVSGRLLIQLDLACDLAWLLM